MIYISKKSINKTNGKEPSPPAVSTPDKNFIKSDDELIFERIREICDKAWGISPSEKNSNSMTIGTTKQRLAFRFNNYRREIEVKNKSIVGMQTIERTIDTIDGLRKRTKISDHTKLITIDNWHPKIMIQYGKTKLTGIWMQDIVAGEKETWAVEFDKIEELNNWVDSKTELIKQRIDDALEDFIRKFDLRDKYQRFNKPQWKRKELGIKGDSFLDSLPRDCILHDTVGKKVYPDQWEFTGNNAEVYAKNYIKTRAIEDISPEIAVAISKSNDNISELAKEVRYFAENINSHIPVYQQIGKNTEINTKTIKKLASEVRKLNKLISKGAVRFLSQPLRPVPSQQASLLQYY